MNGLSGCRHDSIPLWSAGSKFLIGVLFISCCASCIQYAPVKPVVHLKPSPFEQINFEGILKRYLGKDFKPGAPIEGIYEVSCTISKKGKGFLSNVEKEKVVGRHDNFAKVAILKDWPDAEREYMEVSLNPKNIPNYPIIGEFQSFSEGGGYIYKHYLPGKAALSFTFSLDLEPEILEGIRSEVKGSKTITYKLTYLKIYPKRSDAPTSKKEAEGKK